MLTQDLVLDDAAGVESTFKLIGITADGAKRLASGSTLAQPLMLEIKHSVTGKGGAAIDRHLISASRTVNDSAGVPVRAVVNVTFALPRDTAVSATDCQNLFGNLVDLLCDGGFSGSGMAGTTNIAAVLRGES